MPQAFRPLPSRGGLVAVLAAAVMLVSAVAQAGDADGANGDVRSWIGRMNRALTTRNFEGVLVHQVGSQREVLRIVHRVQGGKLSERVAVVSAEGAGREFVRNGPEWVAYYPEQKVALVQTRNRSFGFLPTLNALSPDIERYYLFANGGSVHVNGRRAQLIRLEPRDDLRYGYRFWLDGRTALPLKTQLVTASGAVIEEISFLSYSMPESIPDELLKPDVDTTGFRWMRRDVPVHTPGLKPAFVPKRELLPAGFRVHIFSSPEEEARAEGPRTRFIVSDGVAWVSVFVEKSDSGRDSGRESADSARRADPPAASGARATPPATTRSDRNDRNERPERSDGAAQMGSSAAYVSRIGGVRVTVVGEVPPATVKTIAEAMRPE